ncbi:hypothetical protein GZ78_20280 [Endozoicomonas numazuensis]|uniref:Uncharacterized protein n=1 Tax=Endozoicomonas numazuensis TaxID=1137799 RepID=A0A081NEU2_9GAMM|nr:hypothetical protein GZ78_20280 [Endozoicomonas numazuensis]
MIANGPKAFVNGDWQWRLAIISYQKGFKELSPSRLADVGNLFVFTKQTDLSGNVVGFKSNQPRISESCFVTLEGGNMIHKCQAFPD